ncbi:MAG: polysaccharide deacetylase family protein [Mycobacteriales bacterium]
MRAWLLAAVLAVATTGCASSGRPVASPTTPPASPSPAVTTPAPSPSPTASATPSATASPSPTPTRPTPSPTVAVRGPSVVLRRLPTSRPVVALTFDAGSDPGHTAQVLDLLAARHLHATFGLTGAWVGANPALARRIAAEGHQVVNHTDGHLSWTGRSTGTAPLTAAQRRQELARAEATIRSVTGVAAAPWWRPPYGDRDASVDADAGAAGYRWELLWTVDTLGWRGVAPAEVTRRTLDAAGPGEVVLMHVGAASTDWQALPAVLDGLRARGLTPVRADQA